MQSTRALKEKEIKETKKKISQKLETLQQRLRQLIADYQKDPDNVNVFQQRIVEDAKKILALLTTLSKSNSIKLDNKLDNLDNSIEKIEIEEELQKEIVSNKITLVSPHEVDDFLEKFKSTPTVWQHTLEEIKEDIKKELIPDLTKLRDIEAPFISPYAPIPFFKSQEKEPSSPTSLDTLGSLELSQLQADKKVLENTIKSLKSGLMDIDQIDHASKFWEEKKIEASTTDLSEINKKIKDLEELKKETEKNESLYLKAVIQLDTVNEKIKICLKKSNQSSSEPEESKEEPVKKVKR